MLQKHDIEAHWRLAENFIPMAGEIIVYDPDEVYDYARFKCGDGVTKVNDLPFIFKIDENYATKEYVNDTIANITIEVDNTLTKEGEAADAKAVGDRLTSLEAAFGAYITDIDNIVGDGIETEEEPSEPTPALISFTIDGTSFQAEEGMTWGEWCAEYNYYSVMDNGDICTSSTYGFKFVTKSDGSTKVKSTEVIEAEYAYKTYEEAMSGG